MSSGKVIARATLLIMLLSLVSRFFGLGREMAIAGKFAATGLADAFYVAFTIPNIFYAVAGMALATVIVPIFTEYVSKGRREDAWRLCSMVTNALILVTMGATAAGILAAPLIVGLLGQGFPAGTMDLAVKLMMVMFPSIVFYSLAGLFTGILNANNVFGIPAVGPVAMNVVIIFGALVLSREYGVFGLAFGVLGGAAALAFIQLPALRAVGFRYSLAVDFRHPEVLRVVYLMAPLTLGLAVNQIYMMIDWNMASGLAEGSIAALNYANKLVQLPQSLFVLAVSTAIYPTLSRLIADGVRGEAGETLRRAIKVVLFLTVPAAVGILVLRDPIVSLLYRRGEFDERSAALTSLALLFFSVGVVGQCLVMLVQRGFFAMQDTRTPVMVTLSTVFVKLGLSLIFIKFLAHGGLALATSLTALLNAVILIALLQRRLPQLIAPDLVKFAAGVSAAAVVMGLAVFTLDGFLAAALGAHGVSLLARVFFDIVCGAFVFFVAGFLLRLDELMHIADFVLRSLTGKVTGRVYRGRI
ncbi:MAG: murein biosynthesis integral membrane protein MurJ [Bacillota bacterium]